MSTIKNCVFYVHDGIYNIRSMWLCCLSKNVCNSLSLLSSPFLRKGGDKVYCTSVHACVHLVLCKSIVGPNFKPWDIMALIVSVGACES